MLNGSFPVPRTVACSSGIPGQVTRSSCCRATRTQSSRLHPALLEHSSPPVPVILVPVSGRTEPSHSRKRSVCGARRRKERAQKAGCHRSDVGCRWLVRAASSWHCVILELWRLCFLRVGRGFCAAAQWQVVLDEVKRKESYDTHRQSAYKVTGYSDLQADSLHEALVLLSSASLFLLVPFEANKVVLQSNAHDDVYWCGDLL